MATNEQKEAFRQALLLARKKHGWSQRKLAEAVGVSHSTVAYWERGRQLPTASNVVDLERALALESGTLARLVGYMPLDTMRDEMIGVLDAIMGDPDLGSRERELLATMYHQLVEQRRAEIAEREAREGADGQSARENQDRD